MDRGAQWAMVHGVAKCQTQLLLCTYGNHSSIKLEELCNNIIIYISISVYTRLERIETLHEACEPTVWRAWHCCRRWSHSLQ